MLQNRVKKVIAVLLISFFAVNVFAAGTNDLVKNYVDKAEKASDDGDIDTAYRYINSALKLSKSDSLTPQEIATVVSSAQFIYREKLKLLQKSYDGPIFVEICNYLEEFPEVESSTIKKLKEQVSVIQEEKEKNANTKLQQDHTQAVKDQTEMNRQASEKSIKAQEETTKAFKESATAINKTAAQTGEMLEQNEKMLKQTGEMIEKTGKNTGLIFGIIIGIVILILVIVVIAVMLAHRGFKNQEIQQAQYVQAFKMLAANQHQTNRLMLGGVTDVYGGGPGGQPLRIAGSSKWEAETLTDEDDNSPETQEALKNLAMQCEEIGMQIDQVTNRKNNSKNVSELVYKIAMHLGLPQSESMLYFCAGMIYDAGYLGVDPELFKLEDLTDEQRATLREHVNLADDHLDFIPKKYWQTFDEAAKNHHENMDGSGYPSGIKEKEIPQVARIIRVCESFVSMTSKRGYRATLDKESAIEKLREQPQFYDPDVIDVLEQIV